MATPKRQRLFALFGALLFLVTSSALAVAVIVSMVQQHNANKAAAAAAKPTTTSATSPTTAASSTSSACGATPAALQATKETSKLEGTKLVNFTPTSKVDKLCDIDDPVGTGPAAKAGDKLVVDYTGALAATGVIFQSSLDSGQTFSFTLGAGQVISGWDQGLIGVQAGATRRLIIPSSLGYGSQSQSGIPANSDLVFDITVHSI